MNAGIIGLDCLRFLLRGLTFELLVPLVVVPLRLSVLSRLRSLASVLILSGSESLWKPFWLLTPLWPLCPFWPLCPLAMPLDARSVAMVFMRRETLSRQSGTPGAAKVKGG